MKITKAYSYQDMCRKAANLVSAQVILFPDSVLGLATGSTPLGVYNQLADWYRKGDIDFSKVTTINLDEYCGLPPSNPNSYRYYMNENFFNNVNINKGETYLPNGLAHDFEVECRWYEELIQLKGGIDLQLLGIGYNGHIGFNEPGGIFEGTTRAVELAESTREANKRFFGGEEVPRQAITMGLKSIMKAKKIVLMANGEEKRDILEKALFGPVTPECPASILQLHPDLNVFESCGL